MQAAPTRYVSASELYSTDEVELLLEEIRELEPTSCRGEDVQDFEIAGSGCAGAGGRSPAATDLTDHSWDSHAHYSRVPPPRPQALAPLYCRLSYLLTPYGSLTFLLVLCTFCVCVCTWAAVGLRGAAATRPLLFGALTSLMAHGLLLALHISRLVALFPMDFTKWSGWLGVWSAAWLLSGAAVLLAAPEPLAGGPHRAPPSAALLYATAGVGLCGSALGLALALVAARGGCVRRGGRAGGRAARQPAAAYRAVPQPSTSRDDPL
ncbi:unnamed protein product [Colias eurytheme]|nr:unnamed protein product [Colias eurytheme]